VERSNSSTQLQFNDALKPPAGLNFKKMYATKRNRFFVPWVIQPQLSRTEFDCGVFME
jgi:hypothetical protein